MSLKITVMKDHLIVKIEKYKKRYTKSYKALIRAWKKKAEKFQKEYAEYVLKELHTTKDRPYPPQRPDDRTKSYDKYLLMLNNHSKPFIDLDERTYTMLWLDKWDWMSTHHGWLQDYSDDSEVFAAMGSYNMV